METQRIVAGNLLQGSQASATECYPDMLENIASRNLEEPPIDLPCILLIEKRKVGDNLTKSF